MHACIHIYIHNEEGVWGGLLLVASFQHGCPAVCVHMRTNVLWGVPPCACTCARSCSGAVWCAAVCVHMRTNVFWGGLRLVASFQHGYAAVRVHMRTCVFWGGLRMVFSFQHGCVAVRVHIRTRVLQRQLDAIILLVGCQTPGDPRARTHARACMEQQLHATILLVGCRVPGAGRLACACACAWRRPTDHSKCTRS